jgi:hypothetical protein
MEYIPIFHMQYLSHGGRIHILLAVLPAPVEQDMLLDIMRESI